MIEEEEGKKKKLIFDYVLSSAFVHRSFTRVAVSSKDMILLLSFYVLPQQGTVLQWIDHFDIHISSLPNTIAF